MELLEFKILYFICVLKVTCTHITRMTFTSKEIPLKMFNLSGDNTHIQILQDKEDILTVAVGKHLYSIDFNGLKHGASQQDLLLKRGCISSHPKALDCQYSITLLHKLRDSNQLFLCGNKGIETKCCSMNMSKGLPLCQPLEHFANIPLQMKEMVPSVIIDSPGAQELYIAHSGSEDSGIYSFGSNRIRPANNGKEQRYVSLVVGQGRERQPDGTLFAFYKEKNTDHSLDGDMWIPFVTRICMADSGGPKHYMQFLWTSQLSARLFCGDHDNKQHFSELVDVATLETDKWQDTRIYALFRNEWNMTAVCVYTLGDIDNIFQNSKFKGYTKDIPKQRPGMCVEDSTKLPTEVLSVVQKHSEMEDRVSPVNKSVPLFVSNHHYTHIRLDNIRKGNSQHTVLFLSLQSGRVHKVLEHETQAFFISEYQPFDHKAHVHDMMLSSSRKLYVASGNKVVQVDVGSCAQYGDSCQECILARDPYCGWNGTNCISSTFESVQDVTKGNHSVCEETRMTSEKVSTSSQDKKGKKEPAINVKLPKKSKYFLRCPTSSNYATYSWTRNGKTIPSQEQHGPHLHLIDSMSNEDAGNYTCMSEEVGYTKAIVQYQLQVDSKAAGQPSCSLAWVCLMSVVLMKGLFS